MVKKSSAYGIQRPLEDVFPVPVVALRAPTSSDKNFELGQLWVYKTTGAIYALAAVASGSATWSLLGPGASDVDTLQGDSGGARSPTAGNITLAGGTNITSVGASSTITFNLDAAITLATSVSSPIYTVAAATDLNINAVTGQDIIIKMGDAAAANKVSFVDSAAVEVASIDSNGAFTTTGLTFSGLLTANASATILTAGTALNLGSDNDSAAVNLGVGTTARAIGIGDSAAAHVITIGSITGAAQVDLLVGTGNFSLDGAATSTYTIGASTTSGTIAIGGTAQTGTMTLGDSSGVNIVEIGAGEGATTVNVAGGATAAKVVNIAVGAVANVVTIGSASGAASLDLLAGTGNYTLDGAATTTYTVGASTTSGTISIGGTAQTGTMTLGDSSGVNIVEIGAGEGATTVNVAGGATAAKVVNVAVGAVANVVTIGTVSGAASLDLLAGTGNFTLEGNVATTYDISSTGVNTGTVTLASGTGARTVEIAGGGTGIKTINIGAAATADVITIGTTDGAGSLTLAAGTGNITASGTFEAIAAKYVVPTGVDVTWSSSPLLLLSGNAPALPTGATGEVSLMSMQEGVIMEQFVLGAGQTIIAPVMDATGLLVSGDLTVAEGFEYNFGAALDTSRFAFTIGTSPAFFMEMKYTVADVSGASPYMIGFRKTEANNATLTTYTDYSMIGLDAVASVGTVVLKTELNGAGTTNTNTTDAWTDGQSHTVRINVSAAGVVTYLIDGVAPSVTAAYTFDNTDVVAPFFRLEHAAAAPGAVHWESMQVGFQ